MKHDNIRKHLKPFSIYRERITTINHAFASALALNDTYDENKVRQALKDLGQDPDGELFCFYCDKKAETWDHIFGLVKGKTYSGFGHTLGNLLPCCGSCNSKKGGKHWREFIESIIYDDVKRADKIEKLGLYLSTYGNEKFGYREIKELCPVEMEEYEQLQSQIAGLINKADGVASSIRNTVREHLSSFESSEQNSNSFLKKKTGEIEQRIEALEERIIALEQNRG